MKFKLVILLFLCFRLAGYAQLPAHKIKVSDDIELLKLSENAYMHVSVTPIEGFGMVASNGLIVLKNGEAFLFDTPVSNDQTEVLCTWLADSLNALVTGFIPNHWHNDCMGGLEYLQEQGVKSWANQMTIDLAREKGLPVPEQGFSDSLFLDLQDIRVCCYYLGAGHATDNIVVWIPAEKILFAGCMAKDLLSRGLGNLSDADTDEWPLTIKRVLSGFPGAMIIIPGHGEPGGKELLVHTLELLKKKS